MFCTARYVLIQSYPIAYKSLKRTPIVLSGGIRDIGFERDLLISNPVTGVNREQKIPP